MTGRARIGVAAAVALLLTSAGLLRLLHGGSWVWPIILAVIVSTAAGELFRRLIRSRPLVVAAQALAVFWYDMVLLAHHEAFAGVLPTWAVFHRLGTLYSTGARDIRDTFVGGDPTPGIAAILVLSLSALAVLVDALAATYAAAPLAGLPLLALYLVPATRSGGGYDWLAFALAAGGYTALLSAEGRDRLGRWGRPLVHAGARRTGSDGRPDPAARAKVDTGPIAATGHQITTFALVAAVLAPVLLPTVSGGLFGIGPNSGDGPGSGGGHKHSFSLKVDLRKNLASTSDDVILNYTASKPVYLRFQTADVFSATAKDEAFIPDPKAQVAPFGPNGMIAESVPGYMATPAPKTIKVDIDYLSDSGTRDPDSRSSDNPLPLPYPAKQIPDPRPNGFNIDTDNLAILGPGQVYKGLKYSALVYDTSADQLSADALNLATLPTEDDFKQFHLDNDRQTAGIPTRVSDLAKTITQSKTNPIDKAILIQNYFQKGNGYTYTLKTPDLNGADSMKWLLDHKAGFCQYYASTMVAMARSLGIPARVALGFTPGRQPKGTGTYEVRMHDYHAWPELFFHGVGWLRFEPTAGITDAGASSGNGLVPQYNTVPTSVSSTTPSPTQSTSTAPNAAASANANCPVNVRKSGGCGDDSQNTAAAPKSKFSWLGWFGAVPRFLQYWLFGGSGYAIALRVIALVLLLLACVPMAMRIARRRARDKLASGRRPDRPAKPGRRGESGAEDGEVLRWESADPPSAGRPAADPERLRVLAAWAEVRDSATDLGYSWPGSETPRQSAARIVKQAHLSRTAQEAMDRVTGLTERANYARTLRPGTPSGNPPGAAPAPNLLDDVKAIRAGLAEPVSRRTRMRATVLPPSALAALRERREDLTSRVYERIQGTGTRLRSRDRPPK